MHSHQLTDQSAILQFMFAGKARFTLVSPKTQTRFTYRINKAEDGGTYFVSLLTQPDNENGFTYMGLIRPDLSFRTTRKATIGPSSLGFRAFTWFCAKLMSGPPPCEFWHEGRCGRCGRTLTVPESVESGFGPECITKLTE